MFRSIPHKTFLCCSASKIKQEKLSRVRGDGNPRVVFEFEDIEDVSKRQLHPDDVNATSVLKTGIPVEGKTSGIFNPTDASDFDAQTFEFERKAVVAEQAAEELEKKAAAAKQAAEGNNK